MVGKKVFKVGEEKFRVYVRNSDLSWFIPEERVDDIL